MREPPRLLRTGEVRADRVDRGLEDAELPLDLGVQSLDLLVEALLQPSSEYRTCLNLADTVSTLVSNSTLRFCACASTSSIRVSSFDSIAEIRPFS